jgi:hypothetical protein
MLQVETGVARGEAGVAQAFVAADIYCPPSLFGGLDVGPSVDRDAAQDCFSIRVVRTGLQRVTAQSLVSLRYAQRGYVQMPWGESPESHLLTLSAVGDCATLGTMGVRLDSAYGLKSEEAFGDEVSALRAKGRRLCEFTQLALDHGTTSVPVLASLFHAAHLYAYQIRGVEMLVIEVNPRHVGYYRRMLDFQVCSDVRQNPRVNAPAVLMSLDLAFAQQRIDALAGTRPTNSRSLYPHFQDAEGQRRLLASLREQLSEEQFA